MGGGRRLLAVAIVLASAGTALALQVWPMGSNPESNPAIPVGENGRIVFSLRNDSSAQTMVGGFMPGSGNDCLMISTPVPLDDPTLNPPYTIGPYGQMQFVVETEGFAQPGDRFCDYFATQVPAGFGASFGVTFHVAASSMLDAQPTLMNFGTGTGPETQKLVLTGWQSSPMTVGLRIALDPLSYFALSNCSGSATECTVTVPGNGAMTTANVTCNGSGSGYGSGRIDVFQGANVYASVELECERGSGSNGSGSISPDPLYMTAMMPGADMSDVFVNGSGSLTAVSIVGGDGTITLMGCPLGMELGCAFVAPLPAQLTLVCTPLATGRTAMLVATTTFGTLMSTVHCSPLGGGSPGDLHVDTTPIMFPTTPVGGENTHPLVLQNIGGLPLTDVRLSLGAQGAHFAFSACDASTPCTIGPGSSQAVTLYFRPQTHGTKTTQLAITAEGGSGGGTQTESISMSGTGVGAVMVVESPAAPEYHLDLGSLPRGQTGTANLVVRNDGNLSFNATVSGMAAPLAIDQATRAVSAGSATTFGVACASPTPGAIDQTWTVTSSPMAYVGSPQDVRVTCDVVDTELVVDPLSFDFGEVRTGTPAQERVLTVTNPATGSATIDSLQLREPRVGLSLTPAMTTTTLAPGQSVTATLRLETAEDSDLAGEYVDIDVGTDTLELPVRGKVVTARSRIAPGELRLGTACVGSQVTGKVRLINDGTATLAVERPQMDDSGSFVAATPGVQYDADLAMLPPGMEITADVSPASAVDGPLSGQLTWLDDVPSAYQVPISLEYVTTGTAVSPAGLDFGSVGVDTMTNPQSITLENCDADERSIVVKSVRGIRGPIGAWVLEPRVGFRKVLGPRAQQTVLVSFRPPGRGHYEAEMIIETESGEEKILLIGDARGRDFPSTSFYSCACSAPGAPWSGWPIAVVIVAVSVRRRRGAS